MVSFVTFNGAVVKMDRFGISYEVEESEGEKKKKKKKEVELQHRL